MIPTGALHQIYNLGHWLMNLGCQVRAHTPPPDRCYGYRPRTRTRHTQSVQVLQCPRTLQWSHPVWKMSWVWPRKDSWHLCSKRATRHKPTQKWKAMRRGKNNLIHAALVHYHHELDFGIPRFRQISNSLVDTCSETALSFSCSLQFQH